jgi:uncharacterized heparinase superfamily protein
LSSGARYVHTLRYLRPVQVFGRLWYQARRPRPDLRAAPPVRARRAPYAAPVAPEPTLVARDRVCLLNLERRCAAPADWHPAGASKLWIYHLHYFGDLNAREAATRHEWHREWLERWVRENPPGSGEGWEAYPLSRRIVNWIKWALSGNELPTLCRESLAVQTRWLAARVERHILGNHLLANAAALLHAGLYFSGAEPHSWYERGLGILTRELREQVLADGGHFERSPMYHAAVLADLLDLVNLHRAYEAQAPAEWSALVASMQRWLDAMTHPDGEIAFFNDATGGVAATAAQTRAYAARLGLPAAARSDTALTVLEPSGYVRAQAGPAVLLCDCAPVGPDYLPAHAHADTLSFELSLHGERVLVNSGVSQYGADAERARQRGTAAHNTVVLDGQDSSEVWGGFRTARRARVRDRAASAAPLPLTIAAAHDGYRRLPGRNEHVRCWRLDEQSLVIEDRIDGSFRSAQALFHLHPRVGVVQEGNARIRLNAPHLPAPLHMTFESAAGLAIRAGTWHPGFGVSLANRCIVADFTGPALGTRLEWGGQP